LERKGFGGCWKGRRDSAADVAVGRVNWSFKTGVVAVDEMVESLNDCAGVAAGASMVDAGSDSVASPRANTWRLVSSCVEVKSQANIQKEHFSSGRN
jgi:hypothetical protein